AAEMNLGFLILADHSEAINGKIYVMGGGWNMLRFPQLPHDWAFALSFGLDVPWDETNRRYTLTMHVEDPDGELLGDEFSMEFEAGRPPGSNQGSDQRIGASLRCRPRFGPAGARALRAEGGRGEGGRARFLRVVIAAAVGA